MTTYTRRERARLAFAGVGLAAATVVGFIGATSGAADAATTACANGGAFTGYCGTQLNVSSSPLALNVYQASPKVGAKIWGYRPSDQNGAEDFIWQVYSGGSAKEAIYAPNGVPAVSNAHTNLCITELSKQGGLTVQSCNGNSNQLWKFTAAGPGYTITNSAWGDIINTASQAQAVGAVTSNPHHSEVYNFTTSQAS